MGRKRRNLEHHTLYEISFRTQTGLPLVPNLLIAFLLEGIMARAQTQFDITISHHCWMGNHPHFLVVTKYPGHLPAFAAYLKAESAQMINSLLGRKSRTIWTRGYNPMKIAGPERAKERIAYLYNNPTKAGLEDTIEAYPGLNSWQDFLSGGGIRTVTKVPRSKVPALKTPAISISEAKRQLRALEKENYPQSSLRIEPDAWMQCFADTKDAEPDKINRQIISLVRRNEAAYRAKRKRENKEVIGSTTLQRQSMLAEHEPEKFSPALLIIADDPEVIHDYLYRYFSRCALAKQIYAKWKQGHLHIPMPPGMLNPRPPERASFWSARQL